MHSYPDTRVVFCGDRQIACDSLDMMLDEFGLQPVGLIVSNSATASHQDQIRSKCDHLTSAQVFPSTALRTEAFLSELRALAPALIVSVHFPHLLPAAVLSVPTNGAVNLHPSYLPFNRGWHTPSWAILDGTPAGATLHYMDEGLDSGNILAQRLVPILRTDTAHSLYQRILAVEVDVLREGLPLALIGDPGARQDTEGTMHRRSDLPGDSLRDLRSFGGSDVARMVDIMRALTTNSVDEAAYFESDDKHYAVQVKITELPEDTS